MTVNQFAIWMARFASGAKFTLDLSHFRGLRIGIDAHFWLHSYLSGAKKAAIRKEALFVNDPEIEFKILCQLTKQLVRFLEKLWKQGITPVFFFDGEPYDLKEGENARRTANMEAQLADITTMYNQYFNHIPIDIEKLYNKVTQYPKLPYSYVESCQNTLTMLGVPWVVAPHDGEQLAARCCAEGLIAAVWTTDYDALVFGAPLIIRGFADRSPTKIEVIHLGTILQSSGLSSFQLVELAILLGTDFNDHTKGIGPKTAMDHIVQYGQLERIPGYWLDSLAKVREIFYYADSGYQSTDWQLCTDYFEKLGQYIYALVPSADKQQLITAHVQVPRARNHTSL
jgi:flap endonuclease-1